MNAIHQVHLQSLLSEAETTMAHLYPKVVSFFRFPPAAAGRGGGGESTATTVKWNGKSSASATATCHAFNGGRDHQADHLFPTALAGFGQGAFRPLLWGSPSHCLH